MKNKGDKVERGELIGEANGYVSGNVSSSVGGSVASVEIAPQPLGRGANALLINVEPNSYNLPYLVFNDFISSQSPYEKVQQLDRFPILP